MNTNLNQFILTFVPLFIVIDAPGNMPFVISLTEGMTRTERYRVTHLATATAAVVGLVFLFFGEFILSTLQISVGAFAMAGAIILLVLAAKYIITGRMVQLVREEMIAVVPIGTPLVVGPATITTLLILVNEYPLYIVLLTFLANLLITWGLFLSANQIIRVLGLGVIKAISKVFSLLLAAIAVTMMIHGFRLVGLLPPA